jgi:hypothetical protein
MLPARALVIPYVEKAGQIVLVDAAGQPGDGWFAACVTVAHSTVDPPWHHQVPGWTLTHSLDALGLTRSGDGGLVLFIVGVESKKLYRGFVANMHRILARIWTPNATPGAAVSPPTEAEIRAAVALLGQDELKHACVTW